MHVPTLDQPLSRLTSNIIVFLVQATSRGRGSKVAHGLPAGALHLNDVKLILAASPCSAPMFQDSMHRAAAATGANVVLAHHGLHPESLNDTSFSVLIHIEQEPYLFGGMLLYRSAAGEHWLINGSGGVYIALDPMGLRLTRTPPFRSHDEKSDGVCRAAADIKRAAHGQERFQ